MPEQPRVIKTTYEGASGEAFRLKQLGWTGFGRYESIDAAVKAGKALGKGIENMTLVGSRSAYDLYIKNPNKEELQIVKGILPVVGIGTVVVIAIGLLGSALTERRVYAQDGYLVSVRYPGQRYDLREFVQPENPDVVAVYSQIGPNAWQLLDYVCLNISYRHDIGEWWSFPSETIERGSGDCEDSALLTCSLLKNFTDGYVALGDYQGYGHAWCQLEGQILETTYTRAQPVPDPEHYSPFVLFDDQDVIELWPGALEDIFSLRRNEAAKLSLMAEVVDGFA